MKFSDHRIINYYGRKFERARIAQGILIYLLVLGLCIAGILSGERSAFLVLGLILLFYIFVTIHYYRKTRNSLAALKLALLKVLTIPTSMVG